MNSIHTKMALTTPTRFAERDWYYDFREITTQFDEDICKKVSVRLLERYSVLTKKWTEDLNSECLCRLYFSSKLIMGATLNISSAIFAEQRNLRVVIPYLRYYAALSLLRAVCYTLPELKWEDGNLISISHASAMRSALEHLAKLDPVLSKRLRRMLAELKADRELLSYRAPSSGDDQVSEKNGFLSLCALLSEVAQFNSELLAASVLKYSEPNSHKLLPEYTATIATPEIENHYYGDCEDAYRLDYLARKHPSPTNIWFLMTEGHVEDFFGAWCSEEEKDGVYDPDEYQQIVFDIP